MFAKKSFAKKTVISAMIGSLFGCAFAQEQIAYAGLNSVLKGMLVAAGSPTAYSDQMGDVATGGYLNVSVPNVQYNVISFAPPNISGGCGGINMFMGSFSFISAQQFEQMLEQIGEGLLTFAFYSAIKSMCPSCTTIMQTLEDAMQDMNNAMRNTCELGSGVGILNFAKSMGQAAGEFQKAGTAAVGLFNGFFSGSEKNQESPGAIWNRATKNLGDLSFSKLSNSFNSGYTTVVNPVTGTSTQVQDGTKTTANSESKPESVASLTPGIGNNTWRALLKSQAQSMIGSASSSSSVDFVGINNIEVMEMLMSIVGTTVTLPPSNQTQNDDSSASQGSTNEQSSSKVHGGPQYPAILSLEQMVNGNQDSSFYACEQPSNSDQVQYGITNSSKAYVACLHMTKETFSDANYKGLKYYISEMLFGGGSHTGFINDVLDGKFNDNQVSQSMQDFVDSSPIPILKDSRQIMDDSALSANARFMMLDLLCQESEPYIVDAAAADFGQSLENAVSMIFTGNKRVYAPKGYQSALNNLIDQTFDYVLADKKVAQENNAIMKNLDDLLRDQAVEPN